MPKAIFQPDICDLALLLRRFAKFGVLIILQTSLQNLQNVYR
jgi:hypothetical protein